MVLAGLAVLGKGGAVGVRVGRDIYGKGYQMWEI